MSEGLLVSFVTSIALPRCVTSVRSINPSATTDGFY